MTTSEKNEYERRIKGLQREELRALWQKIWRRSPTGWPPGKAFEYLILRVFELEGATVRYPFEVRWPFDAPGIGARSLEQIDGAIHVGGLHAIVEAKDQVTSVDVEPLAKLRNQLLRRPAGVIGVFFSKSGFSPSARLLAHMMAPHTVLLWDGSAVAARFAEPGDRPFTAALQRSYELAVEEGLVDYNTGGMEGP